jgi:hypothetical protein
MRNRVRRSPVPAEGELARAWEWLAGAGPVETRDGASLSVRYAGPRNRGAGPDFLDAILSIGGGEVRGAVEVHRRSSDWRRHGHGADPAYAAVVLHVVGQDDGPALHRPGGGALPLLVLAAGGELADRPAVAFPCAQAVRAGADPLPGLLAAGEARFAAAVERLEVAVSSRLDGAPGRLDEPRVAAAWEQVAYEGVATALGYERNAGAMGRLAAAVPLAALRPVGGRPAARATEARLLGAAGLLPSQRHFPTRHRRDGEIDALEAAWRSGGHRPMLRAYDWEARQVRPENAPVRRVIALARLARDWPAGGLVSQVTGILRAADRPGELAWRRTLARLAGLVTVPCPAGYWRTHWDFGRPMASSIGQTVALVGRSRGADVVVNVLLPLAGAVARATGDDHLLHLVWSAYHHHPTLAENWITRLVGERAGLAGWRPPSGRRAVVQQGLIALYEGPCRDLRCALCPLGQLLTGAARATAHGGSARSP